MEENTVNKTTIQQPKKLGGFTGKGFMPGVSGNPNGRPKGTISPITRVKQIFQEDPKGFEKFVKNYMKNGMNQKHLVEMLDGKPKQSVDLGGVLDLHVDDERKKEIGKALSNVL